MIHPPGTILQHMYLKERLATVAAGGFVEVGVGHGHISHLLLSRGWSGVGYDVNASALARAKEANADAVALGCFQVCNEDWLVSVKEESVDLVISSMVLEHFDDEDVRRYFEKAASVLRPGGLGVLLVPGAPRHWGIEDDIAGHYRRYTTKSLSATVQEHGWCTLHLAGLTYPLGNLLLGVSNMLVRRAERDRQGLTLRERTELSGDRSVRWKTDFPPWARIFLNERMLRPVHWLQKRYATKEDALVIYCECIPAAA